MQPNSERIASAYDGVAREYDRHLRRDGWIRRALWRHFDATFREGDRVLDVGCGTGLDTLHLALRGVHVTALDVSAAMLEELRAKVSSCRHGGRVDILFGDASETVRSLSGPFDGIVSSFAALNTIDLSAFAEQARRLLRPGGRIIAHLLSPAHGAHGHRRWGRLSRSRRRRVVDVDISGQRVPHALWPADELYRCFFADAFVRQQAYALGVVVSRSAERALPGAVLDAMARFERRVARTWPLISAGRFYVLDMSRRFDGRASG